MKKNFYRKANKKKDKSYIEIEKKIFDVISPRLYTIQDRRSIATKSIIKNNVEN